MHYVPVSYDILEMRIVAWTRVLVIDKVIDYGNRIGSKLRVVGVMFHEKSRCHSKRRET